LALRGALDPMLSNRLKRRFRPQRAEGLLVL
jgi:hypothetical protein